MGSNEVKSVSASVDWITATFNKDLGRKDISLWADEWLNRNIAEGYRVTVWEAYGYSGWTVNGVKYGTREQDDIVTFQSHQAGILWANTLTLASNVSRMDLAVTVHYHSDPSQTMMEHWGTLQEMREDLPSNRNYAIINSMFGGDTLYVGKRTSQYYGRVYNKGLQSGEEVFENSIRYEVECKKPMAYALFLDLQDTPDAASYIGAFVHRWFEDRGVQCPWTPNIAYSAIEMPRKANSDEQSLEWLERQVKPTVQRLISNGLAVDVMGALGIELTY